MTTIEATTGVQTVRDIVNNDYRTAEVFRKWNINYCCGGTSSLDEVCEKQKIDKELLQQDLEEATNSVILSNKLLFNEWPIEFLVDYIIHVHHSYLRQTLPQLMENFESFVASHKDKYPYLPEVNDVFHNLATELLEHIDEEEKLIFPYIKQVSYTFNRKEVYGKLFVRTLRKPLGPTVDVEHERIAGLMIKLRKLTHNYTAPSDECITHKLIYQQMKELDADLVQHKHLENNILIPKAIDLEKELLHL